MDLLFAHLLADMVREANSQQAPDNLFLLPDGVLAWRKLFKLLQDEHEVVSMEISDGRQQTSREIRPNFVRMARNFEEKGIPFIRVQLTPTNTHRELRNDLGGIEYSPTIANLSFVEDGKMTIQKYEGYQEIVNAFNTGRYRRTLEDWAEKKIKAKIAQRVKEDIATAAGLAMAGAVKEREDRLRREYEEKLRQQREEMRAKEEQARKEREKREEEERLRKEEEERRLFAEGRIRVEERRRKDAEYREKRAELLPKLMEMNLKNVPTKEIKAMMMDVGISVAGLLSREDYLERLEREFPELQAKSERKTSSSTRGMGTYADSDFSRGESLVERINNAKLEQMSFGDLKQLARDAGYDPATFASRNDMIHSLRQYARDCLRSNRISESDDSPNVPKDYMEVKLERDALRKRIEDKDDEIRGLKRQVDQLRSDLDVEKRRTNQKPQPREAPQVTSRMRVSH
jgi:hypothetical protein